MSSESVPKTHQTRELEFQSAFQQRFNELVEQGLTRSEAALDALRYANDLVVGSSVKAASSVTEPLLQENTSHSDRPLILAKDLTANIERALQGLLPQSQLASFVLDFYSNYKNFTENFTLPYVQSDAMVETPDESALHIDINSVTDLYSSLSGLRDDSIAASIVQGLELSINELLSVPNDVLKPCIVILENPGLHDPASYNVLASLLAIIDKIPTSQKAILVHWFANDAGSSRYLNYITLLRTFITIRVYEGSIDDAKLAVRVMVLLYVALPSHATVSYKEFYNDALNVDYMESREARLKEFKLWIKDQNSAAKLQSLKQLASKRHRRVTQQSSSLSASQVVAESSSTSTSADADSSATMAVDEVENEKSLTPDPPAEFPATAPCESAIQKILSHLSRFPTAQSFISYPFLLSPATKAVILEIDTTYQMQREMEHEVRAALMTGQRYVMPYLVLRVSRERIVVDTLIQMSMYNTRSDFKKPLKVIFDNEEGVDAGGVRKEFFQVIVRQLLDPSYGMFKYYTDSRLLWFSSDSLETSAEFELIGTLLGVAIYNSIIIDLRMPKAVYKMLKGQSCDLSDLSELEPALGKGLEALLNYDADSDFSVFGSVFQLTYEVFGEVRTVDLLPGGGSIQVDATNRSLYVDLYVKYLMEDSIATQFAAFAKGFKKVCGGSALDLFEPPELELLICGYPALDLNALEEGTKYEDGYDENSPAIKLFWSVVHSFEESDKKLFLQFISGSDRSPIEGLSKLGFVISRNGSDSQRLPSAHTCFNHLLLPEYSSAEVMRDRLQYAIAHAEGFGLR